MTQVSSGRATRGASLILRHCRALDEKAPPAYARLETALGSELARLLVSALTSGHDRPAEPG